MNNNISITYDSPELKDTAMQFAEQHHYVCLSPDKITTPLALNFTAEFTELRDTEKNIEVHIDFTTGNLAHRQQFGGGRGQAIAKAIGLKQGVTPPSIIDATAGLAKDAFVLACLGCPVTLVERSPILVELINDAISRALENEQFQRIMATGFTVIHASSIEYLSHLTEKPDIIYLDPMYPERKKSAAVKKNMQLLQLLLGKENDTETLLKVALTAARKRVIVKRPKGARALTGIKPTYEICSKKTRYDIYLTENGKN